MTEPAITPELVAKHNLTPEEYAHAVEILGRTPSYTELGIFSVMWSEHCSYKNTRPLLKTFPTKSPKILVGAGEENAGIIDIGDGLAIAFKIESHNHPSAVEPFQGAATGVGGIVRDIFTMGARPVCSVNSLRFGPITESQNGIQNSKSEIQNNKRLFSGVVSGIAHYGNCFGIPTIAGEVYFDKSYEGNPLVNAFCLGVLRHEQIARGAAKGIGNPVFYVGPATGRDGLAGAAFASQDLTEESAEQQRGAVQVGDPFMEKLVCEACLELLATGAVAGIQDMGAAGLTSSTVEMAGKGGVGIELDLDAVPQREEGMSAYEMMLSESQERMLAILKPGREADGQRIFQKWGLDAATIGWTTDTGRMVLKHKGEVVCDVPLAPLFDDAPLYDRPHIKRDKAHRLAPTEVPAPADYGQALVKLMACPDMASKRWLWEQYDRHVMADTLADSATGADAGIVRIHGQKKALAVTSDCTPRYVFSDPYEGGKQVVAEAWRNLTAVGADPIAITDNLNFGNPERPEIMGQIVGAIEGMAEACRALDFPVVSGNVSLYNETNGVAIPPTPTVGGVGLIPDYDRRAGFSGLQPSDRILLVGQTHGELGASLYLRELFGREDGAPPSVDLALEKKNGDFVRCLIRSGQVRVVHDLSDGGLICAAAEVALALGVGMNLVSDTGLPIHAELFGEDQARYLIAAPADIARQIAHDGAKAGVVVSDIGVAGGHDLVVDGVLSVALGDLREAHEGWMPAYMSGLN